MIFQEPHAASLSKSPGVQWSALQSSSETACNIACDRTKSPWHGQWRQWRCRSSSFRTNCPTFDRQRLRYCFVGLFAQKWPFGGSFLRVRSARLRLADLAQALARALEEGTVPIYSAFKGGGMSGMQPLWIAFFRQKRPGHALEKVMTPKKEQLPAPPQKLQAKTFTVRKPTGTVTRTMRIAL